MAEVTALEKLAGTPVRDLGGKSLLTALTNGIDSAEKLQQEHSKSAMTMISAGAVISVHLILDPKFQVWPWFVWGGMVVVASATCLLYHGFSRDYGSRLGELRETLVGVLKLDDVAASLAIDDKKLRPAAGSSQRLRRASFYGAVIVVLALVAGGAYIAPKHNYTPAWLGGSSVDEFAYIVCTKGARCERKAGFQTLDDCKVLQHAKAVAAVEAAGSPSAGSVTDDICASDLTIADSK